MSSQTASDLARVRQYNRVYTVPPDDPANAPMLGNGTVGAVVWTEEDTLYCVVNRADLWIDKSVAEPFGNWRENQEETSTHLIHGGRMIMRFGLPVFDRCYLKQAHWEVDLTRGVLEAHTESVFGTIDFTFFVGENSDGCHASFRVALAEKSELEFRLEHYGSRSFHHWYSRREVQPELGLKCGHAVEQAPYCGFVGAVSDGNFLLGGALASKNAQISQNFRSQYSVTQRFAAVAEDELALALLLTGPEYADDAAAEQALSPRMTALHAERAEALARTEHYWQDFWQKSAIDCGDEQLNTVWYLNLFYTAAAQRGKYPARFISELWNFYHDYQAWGFYFHWNQQSLYWPLDAAGHGELAEGYYNWRLSGLARAKELAKQLFDAPGGWVSDVTDRNNDSSCSEKDNHTVMAQIGISLYQHYRYTGDEAFLRDKVFPYLFAAAEFLISRIDKDALLPATCYEGWIKITNAITELVTIKRVLSDLTEAAAILGEKQNEVKALCDKAAKLPQPVLLHDLPAFSTSDGKACKSGFCKGAGWHGDARLAAGIACEDDQPTASVLAPRTLKLEEEPDYLYEARQKALSGNCCPAAPYEHKSGVFPYSELSAVYPGGVVSLNEPDAPLFRAAYNTALVYAVKGGIIAWDPLAVMLARLGMRTQLFPYLKAFCDRWQIFENGQFTESILDREALFPCARNSVEFFRNGEKVGKGTAHGWEFRHYGTEGRAVVASAITEALLQECDGVTHLFPSIPKAQTASFKLYTSGGHQISATWQDGKVQQVEIVFGWSGTLKLADPWQERADDDTPVRPSILTLTGKRGEKLTLTAPQA
jgi:alpha-L-fucosidase 2